MPSDDSSTLLYRAVPSRFRLTPSEKRSLETFCLDLQHKVAGDRPFMCLITNDRELQRLNRTFLGHDYPTDVLSFPSEHDLEGIGEIAISIERADAQALDFGHQRFDELRILILHGILHLAGMDHENDSGEMREAEQTWRSVFQLPSTLLGRRSSSSSEPVKNPGTKR